MSQITSSKSVRTYTKTIGSGKDAVTKKITEETITDSSGKKVTKTTEEIISGSDSKDQARRIKEFDKDADDFFKSKFKDLEIKGSDENKAKDDKKAVKSKTSETSLKDFRKDALKAHNNFRSKHGVPSLKLSDDLNDFAQNWAEHLIKNNSFGHSSCVLKNGDKTGENIATKWSSSGGDYNGQEVTEYWYSEIKDYNSYGSEPRSNQAGHFTQVIWKGSKELGLGRANDGRGRVIVVGSYRPPGNLLTTYSTNVFPPK